MTLEYIVPELANSSPQFQQEHIEFQQKTQTQLQGMVNKFPSWPILCKIGESMIAP